MLYIRNKYFKRNGNRRRLVMDYLLEEVLRPNVRRSLLIKN